MILKLLLSSYLLLFSDEPFKYSSVKNPENYPLYKTRYEYEIYWGFINVGSAYIEVSDVVQISSGVYAYKIVSEAFSSSFINNFFKVRDKNIAYLDTNFERSYGYYKNINEGRYSFEEYTVFDYINKNYYGEKIKNGVAKKHFGSLAEDVFDVLSSLYLYLNPREKEIDISNIKILTQKIWNLNVKNYGIEKIKIDSKKIKAYKLEPKVGEDGIFVSKKGRSLYVYISKDERVPVMLEAEVFIGSVIAKIRNFRKK
jgi:hypothetical protein